MWDASDLLGGGVELVLIRFAAGGLLWRGKRVEDVVRSPRFRSHGVGMVCVHTYTRKHSKGHAEFIIFSGGGGLSARAKTK